MTLFDRNRARRPGVDLLIVVSLGLGIAAMSTVGGIVHSVLLRALPFPSPERLVLIGEAKASAPEMWRSCSYPDYLDWQAQSHSFSDLAVSRPWDPALHLQAGSTILSGAEVSQSFSALLGLR